MLNLKKINRNILTIINTNPENDDKVKSLMTGAGGLILRNESPENQMEAMLQADALQADAHDNAAAQKFKNKLNPLRF